MWTATVLLACLASGAGGYLVYRLSISSGTAARQSLTHCALADAAYVPLSALPGFVRFLDYTFNALPRATGPNYLVEARQVGTLTQQAISGPFRASLDAMARSHGYAIGRYPLTPLSGPIVVAEPGPLETYETHFVFTNATVAHNWFGGRERNGSGIAGAHDTFFPFTFGDESFALRSSDSNPEHETLVYVGLRVGRVVVQFDVLGGTAVSNSSVATLASAVASHLRQDCSDAGVVS